MPAPKFYSDRMGSLEWQIYLRVKLILQHFTLYDFYGII